MPHHTKTSKFDLWPYLDSRFKINLKILSMLLGELVESFRTSPRGDRFDTTIGLKMAGRWGESAPPPPPPLVVVGTEISRAVPEYEGGVHLHLLTCKCIHPWSVQYASLFGIAWGTTPTTWPRPGELPNRHLPHRLVQFQPTARLWIRLRRPVGTGKDTLWTTCTAARALVQRPPTHELR